MTPPKNLYVLRITFFAKSPDAQVNKFLFLSQLEQVNPEDTTLLGPKIKCQGSNKGKK